MTRYPLLAIFRGASTNLLIRLAVSKPPMILTHETFLMDFYTMSVL
jgi:hypothetical protein